MNGLMRHQVLVHPKTLACQRTSPTAKHECPYHLRRGNPWASGSDTGLFMCALQVTVSWAQSAKVTGMCCWVQPGPFKRLEQIMPLCCTPISVRCTSVRLDSVRRPAVTREQLVAKHTHENNYFESASTRLHISVTIVSSCGRLHSIVRHAVPNVTHRMSQCLSPPGDDFSLRH